MTALLRAVAADLGVDPADLRDEALRAVAAAPFVLAGLVGFVLLLAALVP